SRSAVRCGGRANELLHARASTRSPGLPATVADGFTCTCASTANAAIATRTKPAAASFQTAWALSSARPSWGDVSVTATGSATLSRVAGAVAICC
ncbi:hypothetical protein, partial [Cerasicoccus arenae]|uniref:hypothetical protein n=1 Tax=Cerasicoccus arenae TaxID=424488 RepID=UPI001F321824